MTRIQLILALGVLSLALIPPALPTLLWSHPDRSITSPISSDYFELRERFHNAAREYENGELRSYTMTVKGPDGDDLTIDTLWLGSKSPTKAVLHISGTHGVEGFAGSAIQTRILTSGVFVPDKTAVVFIHALNPWGMTHYRRFNENNIDLNRNFFLDESQFAGAPPAYTSANWFLNPERPPSKIDLFLPQAVWLIVQEGFASLKQAIAGGQYSYPKGIYFGGNALAESNVFLKDFVLKHLSGVQELYVVEVHTGLGAWGDDVLIWSYPPGHNKTRKLEDSIAERLTSESKAGVGFKTLGDLQKEVPKILPNTEVYWILQEFGAYGPVRTLRTLKNENQYHHYSELRDLAHWTKSELLESFCPSSKDWQIKVLARGEEVGTKLIGILHEDTDG